jgi:hypothetical protein
LDEESFPWILNHIDCFVSQSRGNNSVDLVRLYPYEFSGHDDEVWDKVGQAVGNLQALEKLHYFYGGDDDEGVPIPDSEILPHILSYVRQRITLEVTTHASTWYAEDSRTFAQAINGHPTITHFEDSSGMSPYESLDELYSALATLPALKSVKLMNFGIYTRPVDESTLANPESLTELLRVPSLRSVTFFISVSHALFVKQQRTH